MNGKVGGASKTPAVHKDFWVTSPEAAQDASHLIGMEFGVDAAASNSRVAKAPIFITPEQDALDPFTLWTPPPGKATWCNPPFSHKTDFIARAYDAATLHKHVVCMMLPYEPITKWWRTLIDGRATNVFVPDGRYHYLHPETLEPMREVTFASAFVVFTPMRVPTQYVQTVRGIAIRAMNVVASNENELH